jgi:hypothetical protein
MDLPPTYAAIGLGKARLRGREWEIELFTVSRQAAGRHVAQVYLR